MAKLNLDINQSLEVRIEQFKSDPQNMKDVNDFLTELLEKAVKEAEIRRGSKTKSRLDSFSLQNGSKRIGAWSNRARSSARVFASRVFTTICNCTTSVRNVVINRNNN